MDYAVKSVRPLFWLKSFLNNRAIVGLLFLCPNVSHSILRAWDFFIGEALFFCSSKILFLGELLMTYY